MDAERTCRETESPLPAILETVNIQSTPFNVTKGLVHETQLTESNIPSPVAPQPVPVIAPETIYPSTARHKGQRVATSKVTCVSFTIQHRRALDMLVYKTGNTMKGMLCEAIADCAVKHGIFDKPSSIMSLPDWD